MKVLQKFFFLLLLFLKINLDVPMERINSWKTGTVLRIFVVFTEPTF